MVAVWLTSSAGVLSSVELALGRRESSRDDRSSTQVLDRSQRPTKPTRRTGNTWRSSFIGATRVESSGTSTTSTAIGTRTRVRHVEVAQLVADGERAHGRVVPEGGRVEHAHHCALRAAQAQCALCIWRATYGAGGGGRGR